MEYHGTSRQYRSPLNHLDYHHFSPWNGYNFGLHTLQTNPYGTMKLLGWKKGTLQAMPGSSAAAAEELQGCDLGQFTQEYVYRKSYPFYLYIYTYMFVCVCAYVYTYIYICVCLYVYMYTRIQAKICVDMYIWYMSIYMVTRGYLPLGYLLI